MIGFFPEIYPDELVYSQICRYYQRTGYTQYVYALDDLFLRRTVHPSIEFVNEYTPDAYKWLTREMAFPDLIEAHTMASAYIRFLPLERRRAAFKSLCECDGQYHNLVAKPLTRAKRYLRYCPCCAAEDRALRGETYWHREHQLIGLTVCPRHKCYLRESNVPISGKSAPRLFPAETEIPSNKELEGAIKKCTSDNLIAFSQYVLDIFREPINLESDTPVGAYLASRLPKRYLSDSGLKMDNEHLYEDYRRCVSSYLEPMSFDMFRKIYNNQSHDPAKICELAFFERIPVGELATIPESAVQTPLEQLYKELAALYELPVSTVKEIGEATLKKYRSLGKVGRKSGPKQKAWTSLDAEYLPAVKDLVNKLYCSYGKPGKVSVSKVERLMGMPQKQMQQLPKCLRYVQTHMESQNEYRARQVTWAVRLFQSEGRTLTRNKLNKFLYYRSHDLEGCCAFITDPEVHTLVKDLIQEE